VSATDGGGGGVDSVMMSSATVANGGDTADVLNSTSVSTAAAAEHTIYTHLMDPSSSIIWVSRRQKNKTVVDFNDARDDQVLGRQWHRQPASRSGHITTPTSHRSIFTGWMLFPTPSQQCQSTEGNE